MTETMDAGLNLLDRQVVDADGQSLGKVDDLQFTAPDGGAPPELVAIMVGQQAYGRRLGGRFGRWWTALAARLAARPEAVAIPMHLVEEIDVTVRLRVRTDAVPELTRGERWLSERFIGRIPGSGRAAPPAAGSESRERSDRTGGWLEGGRHAARLTRAQRAPASSVRAAELLAAEAVDRAGRGLGRVHDIHLARDGRDGPWRIEAVTVGATALAYRFGYAQGEVAGPALLAALARLLSRRRRRIAWRDFSGRP